MMPCAPALLLTFWLFSRTAPAASPAPSPESPLPRPAALEPAVAFWKDVFTRWDEDQVVFHDARDLSRVYEVHRLPPADGTRERARLQEDLRAAWRDSLRLALEDLASPQTDFARLEGRPLRLYRTWGESRDPETYRRAAENLRAQRGIRERFLAGVSRSARYRDDFRRVFREEGVPEELVHLPHVESSYRWDARSSVGAAGMWQFMASTARRYMMVNEAVDERLDPHSAARAAARYLRAAQGELGSWPLAIIAYNHGVDGMRNAIRSVGTNDVAAVIERYTGPLFGFAGRNFYPEFLAAWEAADSLLAEPGDLLLDRPVPFETFPLPACVKLTVLARQLQVHPDTLTALNPALTAAAAQERRYLPRSYEVRLPVGTAATAPERFAALPDSERPLNEPPRTYRVRRGDSLGAIAERHGTTVSALKRLNGIRNPNRLRAGAVIKLPH